MAEQNPEGSGQHGQWYHPDSSPYPRPYPQSPYQSGPNQPGRYPTSWSPVPNRVNPAMRAATADRERAVDVLKAAFAEGRLSQDEYNERMSRAYEARTYGDLIALTGDLPAGPLPVPSQPAWPIPAPKTNSMAVASMVLGLAEFATFGLTAIPAVITGHIARREMRQTGEQGSGMATTGLVLGYGSIIVWLVAILAIAAATARGFHHPDFPAGPGN